MLVEHGADFEPDFGLAAQWLALEVPINLEAAGRFWRKSWRNRM
jgi:hypothetical protein